MQFRVGPWMYNVRISTESLEDANGNEAAGLCVWRDREILISSTIPHRQRLDVLIHELRHAWLNHFGEPASVEDRCNQQSSFTTDFMRQLASQGGESALMRLRSDGVIDTAAGPWQVAGEPRGSECANCGTMVAPQAIQTGPPTHDPSWGEKVVWRWFPRDCCGGVQAWREGCTEMGIPNGRILSTVRVVRGDDAIREFVESVTTCDGALARHS